MLLPQAPICSAQHCIPAERLSLDREPGVEEKSGSRSVGPEHIDVVFKTTGLVEVRWKESMKTGEVRGLKGPPWGGTGGGEERPKGAARRGLKRDVAEIKQQERFKKEGV